MSRRYYSSTFVSTTTSGSILATDTAVTLVSTAGLPASVPWTGVLERGTSNEDLVTVTNVSGSTLTITRGVDGQTAKAHASGVAFDHVVSARDFDEPNSHINDATRDDHTQYAKRGQGLAANVGAASRAGRLYIATDTEDLYSDDGTTVHRYLSKPSADGAYPAIANFPATAWTAYTPTLTGTGWAIGNGTITGRWVQLGKTVHFIANVTFGSTSTYGAAQPHVSLPVGVKAGSSSFFATGMGYNGGSNYWPLLVEASGSSTNPYTVAAPGVPVSSTAPFTWTTNSQLNLNGTYETT